MATTTTVFQCTVLRLQASSPSIQAPCMGSVQEGHGMPRELSTTCQHSANTVCLRAYAEWPSSRPGLLKSCAHKQLDVYNK
eukprot:350819-Chlamydomonas_euryale.AAC.2